MIDDARLHRGLATVAATLGVLALVAGDPSRDAGEAAEREPSYVAAIDVARWIRQPKPGFVLVDTRSDSAFEEYHVPGAENVPGRRLGDREWPRHSVVVLYAEDDARAARAAGVVRANGVDTVRVLRGGLRAWLAAIARPRLAPLASTATSSEQAARREHLELSRYFGGTPFVSPTVVPVPEGVMPSEADAVARVRRRGC